MDYKRTKKLIITISIIALIVSVLCAVAKAVVGYFSDSVTIISGATHDLANAFCCILVIISVCLMRQSVDEKERRHNDKLQGVFSIILAAVLFVALIEIQIISITQMVEKSYHNAAPYTIVELVIIIASIVMNEVLFYVMLNYSKKFCYPPLSANAWHLRLSSFTSLGALLSILFENYLKVVIMDNIISLAIGTVLFVIVYEDVSVGIKKIQGKPVSHHKHHSKKDVMNSVEGKCVLTEDVDAFK